MCGVCEGMNVDYEEGRGTWRAVSVGNVVMEDERATKVDSSPLRNGIRRGRMW